MRMALLCSTKVFYAVLKFCYYFCILPLRGYKELKASQLGELSYSASKSLPWFTFSSTRWEDNQIILAFSVTSLELSAGDSCEHALPPQESMQQEHFSPILWGLSDSHLIHPIKKKRQLASKIFYVCHNQIKKDSRHSPYRAAFSLLSPLFLSRYACFSYGSIL